MNWTPEPEKWRETFNETGYLIVENVLQPHELIEMRAILDGIESKVASDTLPPSLRRHVSLEKDRSRGLKSGYTDKALISNIMELPLFAPVLRDTIIHPRVLDIIEALFESSEFSFHNLKCICKMPGNEVDFQWHRDLPYLPHTSTDLLTCMLCLDDMTEENGATVICPGTHRITPEEVLDEDTDMPITKVPAHRVLATCPAGSAVLFHISVIHGGASNRSNSPRRNIISIWSGEGCYATTTNRYAYMGLMPRSKDPMRQKQVELSLK